MGGSAGGDLGGVAVATGKRSKKQIKRDKQKRAGTVGPPSTEIAHGQLFHVAEQSQHLRYHITDDGSGDVHFHDDSNGFKCAIPAADFSAGWQAIKSQRQHSWRYLDRKNGTLLTMSSGLNAKEQFDVNLQLGKVTRALHGDPVEDGDVFTKMDKLSKGR